VLDPWNFQPLKCLIQFLAKQVFFLTVDGLFGRLAGPFEGWAGI
jgi:hypothetical protein